MTSKIAPTGSTGRLMGFFCGGNGELSAASTRVGDGDTGGARKGLGGLALWMSERGVDAAIDVGVTGIAAAL